VGTITLRLINDGDWKDAVREVARARTRTHSHCDASCALILARAFPRLTRARSRPTSTPLAPQVDAHVGTTFSAGVSCVAFEEAFWTEVLPPPPDAPAEGPETGFRDPVAQPRTMPVRRPLLRPSGRCDERTRARK
jgi:hypothetical protein